MNTAAIVSGSYRDQHKCKKWLVNRSLIPTLPRIELGQCLSPELLLLFPGHRDTHLLPYGLCPRPATACAKARRILSLEPEVKCTPSGSALTRAATSWGVSVTRSAATSP